MKTRSFPQRHAALSALVIHLVSCGGSPPPPPHSLASLRSMIARPQDPKAEGLASAKALAAEAERAYASGDLLLAEALGAEGAARFLEAEALSRMDRIEAGAKDRARREREEADRIRSLDERTRDAELEGAELDRRASAVRDLLAESKEGPASPERIAARRIATRAILGEARLLCSAAALLGPEVQQGELDALETSLARPLSRNGKEASRVTLEETHRALRARIDCLRSLSLAKRQKGPQTENLTPALKPLLEQGWTRTSDARGTILRPPSTFSPSASDLAPLKALALGRFVQVVRKTKSPQELGPESALRSGLEGTRAMRVERLVAESDRDQYDFVFVE